MLFVTAFINLKEPHSKSPRFRLEQFQKLVDANVRMLVFASPEYVPHLPKSENVHAVPYEFNACDDRALPEKRSESKDTRKFLQLMNLKPEFIKLAMQLSPAPSFAWIDFNVFHVVKDVVAVQERLRRISSSEVKGFYIPGCWDAGMYSVDEICWRFCGGFFFGDAASMSDFVKEHEKIKLKTLTWEVNVWAMMEQNGWSPTWYKGDHDDTLFSITLE